MSDQGSTDFRERRSFDPSGLLADLRVAVGKIEVAQVAQGDALDRIERRLDVTVLRDEFNAHITWSEAKSREIDHSVKNLWDDHQLRIGSESTWRMVFTGALTILTLAVTAVGAYAAFHR